MRIFWENEKYWEYDKKDAHDKYETRLNLYWARALWRQNTVLNELYQKHMIQDPWLEIQKENSVFLVQFIPKNKITTYMLL